MRILVVEDDARVAAVVKHGLERDGYAVDVAADGTDALWLTGECRFDAIVLDLMLPDVDGHEVCRRLRAAGDWTPVLMLTARNGVDDEAAALDTGADDFLAKPFAFVVLLARIRALLRRGRPERPTRLRAGDLELDPATRAVGRGGVPIALTPRQFSLLELFLRRKGEYLSKAEILGRLWDFAYDGAPNIVEVYVSQLRRKIDEPFGRHALQTQRLAGYRLDPDGG